ncbi:MAG: hypothetical protein K0Q93_715 [Nocardioidaceae bacterium]|nr:hypothetical protein [Nocardioidaceae bacterium]
MRFPRQLGPAAGTCASVRLHKSRIVRGTPAERHPPWEGGVDELILDRTVSDPGQVDLLAEAALT